MNAMRFGASMADIVVVEAFALSGRMTSSIGKAIEAQAPFKTVRLEIGFNMGKGLFTKVVSVGLVVSLQQVPVRWQLEAIGTDRSRRSPRRQQKSFCRVS